MEKPKSYCEYVSRLEKTNPHRIYHDAVYGRPDKNDTELFELLVLEINQAGLSWNTILNKQENFKNAYDNFNIKKIANYQEPDISKLLDNPGIIRNRLKINAAIHNAKVVTELQKEFGSFGQWLDHYQANTREEWVRLFKKTFKFTGGEIVNEFLMSTGHLPGAHIDTCSIKLEITKNKKLST